MATGVPSRKRRVDSPYELAYDSKMPVEEVLELPPVEPLAIDINGISAQGQLFKGNNLGAMLWLMQDQAVRGKVQCVYIDPPYATSMAFVDREVRHAYDDVLLGAEYIEFLRRRLIVLRELMADEGTIFVHLDQNMIFEAKIIMDEIFGRKNFRNFITRRKCSTKNYTRHTFGNVSDHILFYSKSDSYTWHRPYDQWTKERLAEEYPYVDAATGKRYKRVPVHAPGVRNGATGKLWRGKLPPPGKHWQFTPARLDELDAAGEIYWSSSGNPRRKVFYDANKGIPAQDIWLDSKDPHNQNTLITGYPTEKNFDMLCRIVEATTNPGNLVLDCFSGSGTTLEAASVLGRQFIGIDNSDAAIASTVNRLQNGRKRMGDFVSGKKRVGAKPSVGILFDHGH